MSTLAPPPTSSTTKKTMSSSSSASSDCVSDSGHSSPNSSNADSPLDSFEYPLDSSDPLNFSFLSSASSSSHDSPTNDWHAPGSEATKASMDPLWSQPDLSLFSLDNFNSLGGMDFPIGFDSMLFSNDALFSLNSSGSSSAPSDVSQSAFKFFGTAGVTNTDVNSGRDSITSTSSSGLSLSPVAEHAPQVISGNSFSAPPSSPATNQTQASNEEQMDELAARARQIVGLTMALPFGGENAIPRTGENTSHKYQAHGVTSLDVNIPASFDPPSSSESSSPSPAPPSGPTTARTKTSHTTIERRYRTNLNARIQSLRAAVPALRVLEVKVGNRVGNLSLKAGTRRVGVDPDAEPGQEDVIDERGYIDGVKVARKGSKANVLGKAVEYIRVLKRREMRLKREQDGLKALVRSLVGGPELIQQWETMWRERFGGPEKDEIDANDADADDENDELEDDDDVEEKQDDDAGAALGKKRKRAKLNTQASAKGKERGSIESETSSFPQTQTAQHIPIMPSHTFSTPLSAIPISLNAAPEKRKRGRPRKVPVATGVASRNISQNAFEAPLATQSLQQGRVTPLSMSTEPKMEIDPVMLAQGEVLAMSQAGSQPGQRYLLAAFAFFSFFNSPLSYSSATSWGRPGQAGSAHTHSGSVLGELHPEAMGTAKLVFGWRDVVQISHLAVSIMLLVSIIALWFPRLAKYIPRSLKPVVGVPFIPVESEPLHNSTASSNGDYANEEEKADAIARMALLSALSHSGTLTPTMEIQVLREALGLGTGIVGLMLSLTRLLSSPNKSHSRYGLERRMLEQKAFLRFAELVALNVDASPTTRIQTYLYASKFFSIFSASVKDTSTLALVIRPIWRAKGAALWSLALSRARGKGTPSSSRPTVCKAYETYVLESMTIDEAAHMLTSLSEATTTTTPAISSAAGSEENEDDMDDEITSPLAVLAKQSVRQFVRAHAERVFLQSVTGDEGDYACLADSGNGDRDDLEREMRLVVDAGRSLDSRTATLVDAFERVCNPTTAYFASDVLPDSEETELGSPSASGDVVTGDAELYALLRAIVIYRRIFPSTLFNADVGRDYSGGCHATSFNSGISISLTPMPSPPPSPSRRDAELHLTLRRCLDSAAFDRGDALEDARDRVVDMLTAESSAWPKRLKYQY